MPCQAPPTACASQSNLINFFLRAHFNVDTLTKPCKQLWSPAQAHEAYAEQQGIRAYSTPFPRKKRTVCGAHVFSSSFYLPSRLLRLVHCVGHQIHLPSPRGGRLHLRQHHGPVRHDPTHESVARALDRGAHVFADVLVRADGPVRRAPPAVHQRLARWDLRQPDLRGPSRLWAPDVEDAAHLCRALPRPAPTGCPARLRQLHQRPALPSAMPLQWLRLLSSEWLE